MRSMSQSELYISNFTHKIEFFSLCFSLGLKHCVYSIPKQDFFPHLTSNNLISAVKGSRNPPDKAQGGAGPSTVAGGQGVCVGGKESGSV